jgi:hypothetical protein
MDQPGPRQQTGGGLLTQPLRGLAETDDGLAETHNQEKSRPG